MADEKAAPAPPTTTHQDDRELGYGAVDARPDVDGADVDGADVDGASHKPSEVDAAMRSGGQSGGDPYPAGPTPANQDGDHAGQSHQGYSGGDNPNSTSTKEATHERSS